MVSFLSLIVGLGALLWAVHSRLRDRVTPQWSLGVAGNFFQQVEQSERDARQDAQFAAQRDFKMTPRADKFEFFMLHCEGIISASRVRFGVTEGFILYVARLLPKGVISEPVHLRHSHVTRVDPGDRFLIGVVAPEGKKVESGFLYVRWHRIITGADQDDVKALCFNLGRDERLSWAGRHAIRRTMASPDKVFLSRS